MAQQPASEDLVYTPLALPSPRTHPTRPADLAAIAQRYATFRIEALTTSPKAFGSTLALETGFTAEQWAAKIWRADAVVIVCVAHPRDVAPNASSAACIWVASAILRGPMSVEEYRLSPASTDVVLGTDEDETRWQMTAVFASAAHRGRGLGKLLIQGAKDHALAYTSSRTQSSSTQRVRVRALVHPDNATVLGLYAKMGFVDVARTTGKEAYRTNGDVAEWERKLESLSDEMKGFWTEFLGAIVLEWVGDA
ncbi:N-acetyltransferase domain-containing protein [Mycena chlorophos]|uniref:N-acetyltransferase domain-containing protein n=1 Tax=Mycena chlorophos TaxID=658473 RepID=A0A8H6TIN3_MYCCL|nr:N-acetyltransferase domain-containing protein [Mycena chlorophos]